jgi:ABC-2 type transport system permease protein
MKVSRYLKVLLFELRASILVAMQYRADFFVALLVELFSAVSALVPMLLVFQRRETLAGWTQPQALLVMGWFMILQVVWDGLLLPSLVSAVQRIRKGTLDFVLLKPADAQFLISTVAFSPTRLVNGAIALGIFAYAFHGLGFVPSVSALLLAAVIFALAMVILHSLFTVVVSVAFDVVKMDNLVNLLTSLLEAARWPAFILRGALRLVFTFIIPATVMTTFPAQAMLGVLPWQAVVGTAFGAMFAALLARHIWKAALARYSSASS